MTPEAAGLSRPKSAFLQGSTSCGLGQRLTGGDQSYFGVFESGRLPEQNSTVAAAAQGISAYCHDAPCGKCCRVVVSEFLSADECVRTSTIQTYLSGLLSTAGCRSFEATMWLQFLHGSRQAFKNRRVVTSPQSAVSTREHQAIA